MLIQTWHRQARYSRVQAFTLVEALFAFTILAVSIGGIVYGYSEVDRLAEWSSMSAAAQSYALQGAEQARSASWNAWNYNPNGTWSDDETGCPYTNIQTDLLDIPMKGNPFATNSGGSFTNTMYFATNYVYVTRVTNSVDSTGASSLYQANLRQIQSIVYWTFPYTGKQYSNIVVTMRASDQ
ncbi:MAG TPA: prepilin-type N-terminal cleavage/methylation domain-containing protein [Verrucomicrobiae bacterium]|jgi:type II secretory pathway pseudopilin PulG